MQFRRAIRQGTVLALLSGGVFLLYENTNGLGSKEAPETTSAPTANQLAIDATTKHVPSPNASPTTTMTTVGPKAPSPIGPTLAPTTTLSPYIRSITVMVSGTNCLFIDDKTGQEVHSFKDGEVVSLSTNQNGAGFVGVDGENRANFYTLAVKLSPSKEFVQLKFGVSVAAQCQDTQDYAKLTNEPHQATPDEGKATIPVTERLSDELLNGDNFDKNAFKKTDIVTQSVSAGIELPGLG